MKRAGALLVAIASLSVAAQGQSTGPSTAPCGPPLPLPDASTAFYRVCFRDKATFLENRHPLADRLRREFDRSAGGFCFVEELDQGQKAILDARSDAVEAPAPLTAFDVAPTLLGLFTAGMPPTANSVSEGPLSLELSFRLARATTAEHLLRLFEAAAARLRIEAKRTGDARVEIGKVELQVLGPTDVECSEQLKVGVWASLQSEAAARMTTPNDGGVSFLDLLAASGVLQIERFEPATLRNATTSWVVQSGMRGERSLFRRGLRGRDQVLALFDDLPDIDHCFFAEQCDAAGLCRPKLVARRPISGEGRATVHGSVTAGILAGQRQDAVEDPGNGQAPEARIHFGWVWDFASSGKVRTTLPLELSAAHANGARVFSNSWGSDQSDLYTQWAHDVDAFTRANEDALVVFAVSNGASIASPETAKNALAVGASRQADLHDRIGSGGAGPTFDGRRKPELFVPGCRIRSAALGTSCAVAMAPGAPRPGRHHEGSCATSWAAPAVAGAAALVRQYFLAGWYPAGAPHAARGFTPTGALLKAMLLNATRDMGPSGFPSDQEGWGRLVLEDSLFFAGDQRRTLVFDVRNAQGFDIEPATRRYAVRVTGEREPLRVTLVWTEPASEPSSTLVVNDLDLRVQRQGSDCFYHGNDFVGGQSACRAAGAERRDSRNNVEQVLIATPVADDYEIEVRGVDVKVPTQGYALVVTGEILEVTASGPGAIGRPAP